MKFLISVIVLIFSTLTAYSQLDLFEEIDSTKSYHGSITLNDHIRIESNNYMVKKDIMLVRLKNKYLYDTIHVADVKSFTLDVPSSMWHIGMGAGLFVGIFLAATQTDNNYPPKKGIDVEAIVYIVGPTAFGTLIGSMITTTKTKRFNIRKYYGISMDLKYKQINPELTQNALNLKFSINI